MGVVVLAAFVLRTPAAIIGTNPPALSVTEGRIAELHRSERSAWRDYLKRSDRQRSVDQAFLEKEMRRHSLTNITVPAEGRDGLRLNAPPAWYAGPEGHRVADNVVSFQTPAGGWGKNLDMTRQPRAPGMLFGPDNNSRRLGERDFDAPPTNGWNYIGTFDNDATITQLRFLARVVAAGGTNSVKLYRAAFLRGLDYIFAAQYPNGGWPQVWPLQGEYHDAVTFNDNALSNILALLRDVGAGTNDCSFVPSRYRRRAARAVERGIGVVLATQIIVSNRPTAWAQQYDALTLEPTSARNYEMPALAAGESAQVLSFLMRLPHPDRKVVAAVYAGAAWFQRTGIRDVAFRRSGNSGRTLVAAPGAGPIWARYYQIGTDRPIFGDRDKTIHDDVNEISLERRNGYAWFGPSGVRVLEEFAVWWQSHPTTE
jgi:PelA/Pel-15E family pectate lyase